MKVTGVKSVQRSLQKLADELDDEVNDAVSDSLASTERRAKRKIISNDTVETGELYRSFVRYSVSSGPYSTRHTLNNVDPKARLVEWGTGGYFGEGVSHGFSVPSDGPYDSPTFSIRLIRSILGWIIKKPGFRTAGGPPREAAPAIAKAIADGSESRPPGTPAQPFMRPSWAVEKPALSLNLMLAVHKAVRRA